jgi:hypothetical protein
MEQELKKYGISADDPLHMEKIYVYFVIENTWGVRRGDLTINGAYKKITDLYERYSKEDVLSGGTIEPEEWEDYARENPFWMRTKMFWIKKTLLSSIVTLINREKRKEHIKLFTSSGSVENHDVNIVANFYREGEEFTTTIRTGLKIEDIPAFINREIESILGMIKSISETSNKNDIVNIIKSYSMEEGWTFMTDEDRNRLESILYTTYSRERREDRLENFRNEIIRRIEEATNDVFPIALNRLQNYTLRKGEMYKDIFRMFNEVFWATDKEVEKIDSVETLRKIIIKQKERELLFTNIQKSVALEEGRTRFTLLYMKSMEIIGREEKEGEEEEEGLFDPKQGNVLSLLTWDVVHDHIGPFMSISSEDAYHLIILADAFDRFVSLNVFNSYEIIPFLPELLAQELSKKLSIVDNFVKIITEAKPNERELIYREGRRSEEEEKERESEPIYHINGESYELYLGLFINDMRILKENSFFKIAKEFFHETITEDFPSIQSGGGGGGGGDSYYEAAISPFIFYLNELSRKVREHPSSFISVLPLPESKKKKKRRRGLIMLPPYKKEEPYVLSSAERNIEEARIILHYFSISDIYFRLKIMLNKNIDTIINTIRVLEEQQEIIESSIKRGKEIMESTEEGRQKRVRTIKAHIPITFYGKKISDIKNKYFITWAGSTKNTSIPIMKTFKKDGGNRMERKTTEKVITNKKIKPEKKAGKIIVMRRRKNNVKNKVYW